MSDPKWREFEVLIARIEQWLGPRGAEVKSPDRIVDRATGQLREVDASIRFHVGSAPILVTVECRDRARVEDVTWIEQIAAKRDGIGAALTVAVSSSGFTAAARTKAGQLRIELREIRDITEDVAGEWAHNVKITLKLMRWNVVSLELRQTGVPVDQAQRGGLPADLATAFENNPTDTKIGYERCSGKALTVRSIVKGAMRKLAEFASDLTAGKPRVRKTITVRFPPDSFAFFTEKGERDLEQMKVTVDVWLTSESPASPKVFRYESAGETIIEVAQLDYEMEPGRRLITLFSRTAPADTIPVARNRAP